MSTLGLQFDGGLLFAGFTISGTTLVYSIVAMVALGWVGVFAWKAMLNRKSEGLSAKHKDTAAGKSAMTRKYPGIRIFSNVGAVTAGGLATAVLVIFLMVNWT